MTSPAEEPDNALNESWEARFLATANVVILQPSNVLLIGGLGAIDTDEDFEQLQKTVAKLREISDASCVWLFADQIEAEAAEHETALRNAELERHRDAVLAYLDGRELIYADDIRKIYAGEARS